ncbi:MAG: hypothetical protein A3F46_07185 [Legionellales bacterium RIFCSPHIGHO2_12_FULL_42_9]|nr:MAG: hypothetical protein A3F46_07185 [Legionellales bacterium RIFCSPHIGHO2_12_FULL_42_9]
MKFKSFLLLLCLSVCSLGYADNRHVHPQSGNQAVNSAVKNAMTPGYCQVEIINDSNQYVTVSGRFDDGAPLQPFNIYPHEIPHYISLFYYNFCHQSMYLSITSNGYVVFGGYANVNSTIHIVPYLKGQLKAKVSVK